MTPQVKHFLETWHKAVETRDEGLLASIIAEGCELHSPVVWKPSDMSCPRVNGFLGPLQETLVIHVQHELACDLRRRPKPVDPTLT